MAVETEAVLLRRFDFSETSQIGHFYSRDLGRVAALAKGIKRPNASLKGPMDLFHLARVRLTRRGRSDLFLVERYDVVSGFRGVRRVWERLMAAFYLAEIFAAATPEHDPDEVLFGLLVGGLQTLSRTRIAAVPGVLAALELAFIARSGVRLDLERCVACGVRVVSGRRWIAPQSGGSVCLKCRPTVSGVMELSGGASAYMRRLSDSGLPDAATILGTVLQHQEIRRLLDRCLQGYAGRTIHSAAFLVQPAS